MTSPFNFPTPDFKDLEETFAVIEAFSFDYVPGVMRFDSGQPGPVLGITICTHGNEPSGIAALRYVMHMVKKPGFLKRGQIFFVLNNLKATRNYFSVLEKPEGPEKDEAKKKTRFVKINMNRLPADVMSRTDDTYEFIRARELQPIWQKFTIALDIHSVSNGPDPFVIACGGLHPDLIAGFPVQDIVTNIENVQRDKPAVYFYGTKKTVAIEAGNHENPSAFTNAIACTHALLENLGMIDSGNENRLPKEYNEYHIVDSLFFPNETFRLVRPFKMFEPIVTGQILARGDSGEINSSVTGHALLGPKGVEVTSIQEEVIFISDPVKKLTL